MSGRWLGVIVTPDGSFDVYVDVQRHGGGAASDDELERARQSFEDSIKGERELARETIRGISRLHGVGP